MGPINLQPGPAKLRAFGLTMVACSGMLGAAFFLGFPVPECRAAAYAIWIGGCAAAIPALAGSRVAVPFHVAWMSAALVIGTATSTAMLVLVYYSMFAPIGFAMRLSGRDRLGIRKSKSGTYWSDIDHHTETARYERQF